MSIAGIILLVIFCALFLFELVSLVTTLLKRRKLKKEKAQQNIEVNNVVQEDSINESSQDK